MKDKKTEQILDKISEQLKLASKTWDDLSQDVELKEETEKVFSRQLWEKLKNQMNELSS